MLPASSGENMKAVQYADYGGPENLKIVDLPVPKPSSTELLIRVIASSVNPVDWKLASGKFKYIMPIPRPAVPGFDVVGEVLQVGAEMTGFEPGQRVVARLDSKTGGACAEQCVVSRAQAVLLPSEIDAADGAALPLAGMTALQALRDDCDMKMSGSNDRVLIIGASGGVGHYAVQLAALAGAHVTGVCSTRNLSLVKELGAHEVIDYRRRSDFDTGEPYDIIVDCAGKAEWKAFDACLAPDGKVSTPAPHMGWIPRLLAMKLFGKRRLTATMLKPNAADLQILVDLMAQGKLRSVIGAKFGLESLSQAWQANIKGGVQGKIVIEA